MSALTRLMPRLLSNFASGASKTSCGSSNVYSAVQTAAEVKPGGIFNVVARYIIRVHFPRPSETKRVLRHGWKKRMSDRSQRKVLMNRILKGRFVYSH